jgi:hypothetical protein
MMSVVYENRILSFVGLGLTFWGAILFYVGPEDYVKGTILSAVAISSMANLSRVIKDKPLGKAVYLPPRYLRDFESSRVYWMTEETSSLPTPEEIQQKEEEPFSSTSTDGFLVVPPGAALMRLSESKLKKSFAKVDMKFLESNLPRLFTESLEICGKMEMQVGTRKVNVAMEDSVERYILREEPENYDQLAKAIGWPVTSAIACALAKCTGEPVVIEKHQATHGSRRIEVEYGMLSDKTVRESQP